MKPLSGKPRSRSGGLRKRPARGWIPEPLAAEKPPDSPSSRQIPPCAGAPASPRACPGAHPPLFSSESAGRPGVAPRRWEVRCPGRDEACRSASPRLPRPKKGRSRPGRARPRATGPGLHLDGRGARGRRQPGRAATPRWEEARGREGRRRPPRFPRRLRT